MKAVSTARILTLIVPLLVTSAYGQLLTNEQVVSSSVKTAAENEFEILESQSVQVITDGTPLNELIASALADAIRDKSAEVLLSSEFDSTTENLSFAIKAFEFKYKKGSSRGFLRHRRIRREFNGSLQLNLVNGPDGRVLHNALMPISYKDQIDPGVAGYVASHDIKDLAPSVPGSKWAKFAEPALIVASVSVIVYLFFASR